VRAGREAPKSRGPRKPYEIRLIDPAVIPDGAGFPFLAAGSEATGFPLLPFASFCFRYLPFISFYFLFISLYFLLFPRIQRLQRVAERNPKTRPIARRAFASRRKTPPHRPAERNADITRRRTRRAAADNS
jgi:hypothetical protein